jgi:hypothetical protein
LTRGSPAWRGATLWQTCTSTWWRCRRCSCCWWKGITMYATSSMALQINSWQISRMCEKTTLNFCIRYCEYCINNTCWSCCCCCSGNRLPVGVLLSHIHSLSFSQTNETQSQSMFKQNTGTKNGTKLNETSLKQTEKTMIKLIYFLLFLFQI